MIGIFDSGVGGLSVWKEIYALLPKQDYIYVSDSAHCPYGRKSPGEIIERAQRITNFLVDNGAQIIVVACNTATAAAINYLRSHFDIPFVGMEPAIKPAALKSESGVIGVLATAGTFKGSLYLQTLANFASNVNVIEQIGDGLVELVEQGKTEGEETEKLLRKYIAPMLQANADHVVLGCTHYPFLSDTIKKIAGENVKIVNPAPAVALQVQKILDDQKINSIENSRKIFISTGAIGTMKTLVQRIIHDIDDCEFLNKNI